MVFLFYAGVNSFQVYMAYKDYYQMSNSEVRNLLTIQNIQGLMESASDIRQKI